MKTRILALLLVIVLALGALVACGPTTPPEPEDCVKCVDNNNDKKCDVCGKPIKTPDPVGPDNPEVDETPDVTWNETVSLNYFLTENSNNGELSSGCRHYMAGNTDKVDDLHTLPFTCITHGGLPVTDWEGMILGLRDIGYRGFINFEAQTAFRQFPKPTHPALCGMFAAIGRYFSDEITKE